MAALLVPYGVAVLPTSSEARRTCAMEDGFAGGRRPMFIMRYSGAELDRLPQVLTARLRSGRYTQAVVGACPAAGSAFTSYNIAVLLF